LSDSDDDVRSVSAACLLPIAGHLVTKLPKHEVQILLHVLWDCLSEGGDELGSSTGVVMDLLGGFSTLNYTDFQENSSSTMKSSTSFVNHPWTIRECLHLSF
jgi:hypothetical protein